MEYEAVGSFIDLAMEGADVQLCLNVVHECLAAHRHALTPIDLSSRMGLLPGCNPVPLGVACWRLVTARFYSFRIIMLMPAGFLCDNRAWTRNN